MGARWASAWARGECWAGGWAAREEGLGGAGPSAWERVGLLESGPGEGRELGQEGRRGKDWARAGFLGRVSVGFGFEFWFSFSISNSNKV